MAAVSSNYILKESDIPHLLEILAQINFKWEELATALGLPKHIREQCKHGNNNNMLSLSDSLREWLSGNGIRPANLGNLKLKLGTVVAGETTLADELIQLFNKKARGVDQAASSQREEQGEDQVLLSGGSSSASSPLTVADLHAVLNEIFAASAKWEFIGLALGLSDDTLETIGKSISDPAACLRKTLKVWLQSGEDKTWNALAEAMDTRTVGRPDIKKVILESHC